MSKVSLGNATRTPASENEGGAGLAAYGVVTSATATPLKPGLERQTPRVSITIRRTALVQRRLGRGELKGFSAWNDGRPETELNFKFYRQATNKIACISDRAGAFLRGFFYAELLNAAWNNTGPVGRCGPSIFNMKNSGGSPAGAFVGESSNPKRV